MKRKMKEHFRARRGISISALSATLALALALGFAHIPLASAQVSQVIVGKHKEYQQTSSTAVALGAAAVPCHGCPFGFAADVNGTNISGIAAPVLTGPANIAALGSFWNGGNLGYNSSAMPGWRLGSPNADDWSSPTQSDLDSKFPNGIYTLTVNGIPVALNLTGDAYPAPPLLTLTGGKWSSGKYVLDPDDVLTITTSAYTGYGSHADDAIAIFVQQQAGPPSQALQLHSIVPGSNTLTVTVPAGTFLPGNEYVIGGVFNALVDVKPNGSLPGSLNVAAYGANTFVTIKADPAIFDMTVVSNITPTVANVTANIGYRPQDIGSTQSVYVFAVAPSTFVAKSAGAKLEEFGGMARRSGAAAGTLAKDTAVACVLAQVTAGGQLTAASSGSLQAYLTGVLGSQGASISVLNNANTQALLGAVFYVGYGTNSQAMLNNGINRRVTTVPGALNCDPQPPQTGWWWNKNEPGRGFSVETQGNHMFMAGYFYDASGRATWTISGGLTSLDGSFYNGTLQTYANGQTLSGTYHAPVVTAPAGQVTLSFSDARNGTLIWPGGAIPIERFDSQLPPASGPAPTFEPEDGWWWNASATDNNESGRGFFMEFKNNFAFIAGYMYDAGGNPLWYVTNGSMPAQQTFQANWLQFANGQTLTGAWKPAGNGVPSGAVTLQFSDTVTGTLTLPTGKQIPITRFKF